MEHDVKWERKKSVGIGTVLAKISMRKKMPVTGTESGRYRVLQCSESVKRYVTKVNKKWVK
jgi:hypothetical protein